MPRIYLSKKEISALIMSLEDAEDETLRAALKKLQAKGEVAYLDVRDKRKVDDKKRESTRDK